MERVKTYIANHIVSWLIELTIIGIVGVITIAEVRQTNEQTREMLSAISAFAADRQEAVGGAIDSIATEAQNIKLEGKVDVTEIGEAASGFVSGFFGKTNEEEEDHDND